MSITTGNGTHHFPPDIMFFELTHGPGSRLLHSRTEIGSINTNQDVTDTTLTAESTPLTFPRFKMLPPEIRAIIWEHSFGEARIFKTKSTSIVSGIIPMVVSHKPPPSSQACKEAREVSQRVGRFLFGACGSPYKSLWFNTSKDIFWWGRQGNKWDEIRWDGHFLHCVENVALDLSDPDSCFEMVHDMCCIFPLCRKLQLVLQHKEELGNDVRFSKVSDNHQVSIMGLDRVVPWEVIEVDFDEAYALMYADEDMQIPQGALPPLFEVVEVVPIRDGEN